MCIRYIRTRRTHESKLYVVERKCSIVAVPGSKFGRSYKIIRKAKYLRVEYKFRILQQPFDERRCTRNVELIVSIWSRMND
jgi:hypothetical protein